MNSLFFIQLIIWVICILAGFLGLIFFFIRRSKIDWLYRYRFFFIQVCFVCIIISIFLIWLNNNVELFIGYQMSLLNLFFVSLMIFAMPFYTSKSWVFPFFPKAMYLFIVSSIILSFFFLAVFIISLFESIESLNVSVLLMGITYITYILNILSVAYSCVFLLKGKSKNHLEYKVVLILRKFIVPIIILIPLMMANHWLPWKPGNESNVYSITFGTFFQQLFYLIYCIFEILIIFLYSKSDLTNPSPSLLTTRELQVARLLSVGNMYNNISEQLNISLSTVQSHVKSIYSKINIKNKMQLLAYFKDQEYH